MGDILGPVNRGSAMRITIRLDDEWLGEATPVVTGHGTMPAGLTEESGRERLPCDGPSPPGRRSRLAATGAGGVLPGADLDGPAPLPDPAAASACGAKGPVIPIYEWMHRGDACVAPAGWPALSRALRASRRA